jgi:putative transposase
VPRKIVTDQLRSYPTAKADIPELAHAKHVFVKAAARVSNRAENSHQPTRRRERQMCGFRDARPTQAFLSCFGPIRQHFELPRHQMSAACHRAALKERFATWPGWTVTAAADKVI